jgi:hypothetical protein
LGKEAEKHANAQTARCQNSAFAVLLYDRSEVHIVVLTNSVVAYMMVD